MYPFVNLGFVQLPSYGLCILAGVILGVALACFRAPRFGLPKQDILFACVFACIGAFLGAKLLYLITNIPQIIANWDTIFASVESAVAALAPGLVFYGGLIGGLISLILYGRHYKLSTWRLLDCVAVSIPLMHAFGRVGCFLAGCCYGLPMAPPWGVFFPEHSFAPYGQALFPVQLLEAALNFIVYFILASYVRKKRSPGQVVGFYLVLYAVERFGLEFLRYDTIRGIWFGLSTSQWISLVLLPIGLFLLLRSRHARKTLSS